MLMLMTRNLARELQLLQDEAWQEIAGDVHTRAYNRWKLAAGGRPSKASAGDVLRHQTTVLQHIWAVMLHAAIVKSLVPTGSAGSWRINRGIIMSHFCIQHWGVLQVNGNEQAIWGTKKHHRKIWLMWSNLGDIWYVGAYKIACFHFLSADVTFTDNQGREEWCITRAYKVIVAPYSQGPAATRASSAAADERCTGSQYSVKLGAISPRRNKKEKGVTLWQVRQRSNDRFNLKGDRDKHYLRAASSSAAADLPHTPKTASVHWVCTDLSWGKFLSTTVPHCGRLQLSALGHMMIYLRGKIPPSWTHAWAARPKARDWRHVRGKDGDQTSCVRRRTRSSDEICLLDCTSRAVIQ